MPFVSKKQARFAHSPAGLKAFGGPSAVSEWDAATDLSALPEAKGGGVLSDSFKARRKSPASGVLGKRFQTK